MSLQHTGITSGICIFRNELIQLLKLAKTSFGEQGFRKKKIDEIVKRVAEVIFPGNIKEEVVASQTTMCDNKQTLTDLFNERS